KWHLGGKGSGPENRGFDLNIGGNHAGSPPSYFYPYRNAAHPDWAMPGMDKGLEGEYLTDRLTSEAEKFIERNRHKPFLLYLAHYAVHIPLAAKQEMIARYKAKPGQAQT